jgi:hypothetical protein
MTPMPRYARNLSLILLVLGLLAALQTGGCVQTSTTPQRRGTGFQPGDLPEMTGRSGAGGGNTGNTQGQPASPDELVSGDRCPARLHDIEGALLEYYVDHRALPENLNELHTYAPNLPLTCPDSNLPYAYAPGGLRKPGATKHIIVYDPNRNPDGTRWCILATDAKPGKPVETEVVQLPEPLFLAYQ